MRTHNPVNERIKREYFTYLKEAKRYSDASLDGVAKALSRFEAYTRHKDYKAFHIEQATAFKRHLAEQVNGRTKEQLSKATLSSTLAALKSSSSGSPAAPATVRSCPMRMPSTSTSRRRRPGSRRRVASSVCPRLSRSFVSSRSCRRRR